MNKHVPQKRQSMAIFSLNEDRPKISETAFIAPNATVIGQVRLGAAIFGRSSLRLKTAMLCCFRGTCLFMIAIPPVC